MRFRRVENLSIATHITEECTCVFLFDDTTIFSLQLLCFGFRTNNVLLRAAFLREHNGTLLAKKLTITYIDISNQHIHRRLIAGLNLHKILPIKCSIWILVFF
jgi:hypothetical protein